MTSFPQDPKYFYFFLKRLVNRVKLFLFYNAKVLRKEVLMERSFRKVLRWDDFSMFNLFMVGTVK